MSKVIGYWRRLCPLSPQYFVQAPLCPIWNFYLSETVTRAAVPWIPPTLRSYRTPNVRVYPPLKVYQCVSCVTQGTGLSLATFSSRTLLLSEYFLPLLFLQLQSEKRKLLPYIACLCQGDVLNLIEMMHRINIFKCRHDNETWHCHICRACSYLITVLMSSLHTNNRPIFIRILCTIYVPVPNSELVCPDAFNMFFARSA